MDDSEILVVSSKVKKYIKTKFGMNTSKDVADKLSDCIRSLCADAAESAKNGKRKTMMAKDF